MKIYLAGNNAKGKVIQAISEGTTDAYIHGRGDLGQSVTSVEKCLESDPKRGHP